MPPKPRDEDAQLASLMAEISREHGKGSFIRFGDAPLEVPDTFSTGSIRLDEALGIGGYPRGRVIEAFGPESSGKTTLALHAVASAQKAGMRAAFIDAEHALDPVWADALGVDMDNLYLSQPDNGEQALQITAKLAKSGLYGIVAIDSVSALTPRAEVEGEIGDSHVGLQARMMSQGLRMMVGAASTTATTIFFINQMREKIGIMFGSPETTSGGKALKFYASIRLDVRGIDTVKDGTEAVGRRCRVKVVKNKLGPPFKQAELDIMFSEGGISRNGELIDMGVERGVMRKAGAWYSYEGENIGQGKERTREYLRDNPAVADKLEAAIRAAKPVTLIAPRGRVTAEPDPAPWDENA